MKIKNIKLYTTLAGWREWLFLKIETNTEVHGWSECTDTFQNRNAFLEILKDFQNLIINEDPLNIKRILWKLNTKSRSNPGSLVQRVISAIENTLWDISGKYSRNPVYRLLGKKVRNKIEIYWSHCGTTRVRTPQFLNKPAIKNLEDVKILCDEINKSKFKVIKTNLAIFNNGPKIYMPGHKVDFENPTLKLDSNIFREFTLWIEKINNNLNKDIFIAVDLNFNFNVNDLIKISKKFEKYRIKWLEIDNFDHNSLQKVKKNTKIPIITGECIMFLNEYKNFIDKKCADYFSIDVVWNGISESIKIAQYAKKKNAKITTHNYNGALGSFMSFHLATITPNFFLGEIDIDEVPNIHEIFSDIPKIDGNYVKINDKPGWGCDLNEKKLKIIFNAES
jgi:L-alanine-DL-glutamate epimerase-like enolase superfamily enzyme